MEYGSRAILAEYILQIQFSVIIFLSEKVKWNLSIENKRRKYENMLKIYTKLLYRITNEL